MTNLIKSIEKVSEYQIKITLTKAEAPFLANMAMSFMSIISKEYGENLSQKKRQSVSIITQLAQDHLSLKNMSRTL